jgi:hypothetical protein
VFEQTSLFKRLLCRFAVRRFAKDYESQVPEKRSNAVDWQKAINITQWNELVSQLKTRFFEFRCLFREIFVLQYLNLHGPQPQPKARVPSTALPIP